MPLSQCLATPHWYHQWTIGIYISCHLWIVLNLYRQKHVRTDHGRCEVADLEICNKLTLIPHSQINRWSNNVDFLGSKNFKTVGVSGTLLTFCGAEICWTYFTHSLLTADTWAVCGRVKAKYLRNIGRVPAGLGLAHLYFHWLSKKWQQRPVHVWQIKCPTFHLLRFRGKH